MANPEIYLTTNGGLNWKKVPDQPFRNLAPGSYIMLQSAILSNQSYVIKAQTSIKPVEYKVFRTEDGGNSWFSYPYPQNCSGNWKFIDSLTGWSVGGDPLEGNSTGKATDKIVKTTDGGKTWSVLINDTLFSPHYQLSDIDFYDHDNGVAVGLLGKVIRTTDGGSSWAQIESGNIQSGNPPSLNVAVINTNELLVSSYFGKIYKYEGTTGFFDDLNDKSGYETIVHNPIFDFISINIIKYPGRYEIYSIIGEKIISGELSEKINVSYLTPGIYFLCFKNYTQKFIKTN
jgi:photosystem II stability/assembly factor-like uncharacterized protein